MKKVDVPKPLINEDSSREDIHNAFELFDSNLKFINNLISENANNCSDFIDQNRKLIKRILPEKGKVYRVIKSGGWVNTYNIKANEPLIKYVLITFLALRKNDSNRWQRFIPSAKAIPLDENGKLIRYTSYWDFGTSNTTLLGENGNEEIIVTHLSLEDYPNILLAYKNSLKKVDDKELKIYKKIQKKIESGELKM